MSSLWFQLHLIRPLQPVLRSKWAHLTAVSLTLFFLMPVAALAQNSPFDTGFTAIQSLFTGTIAKVASLVAIVIGGYGFAHGEPGAKKALADCPKKNRLIQHLLRRGNATT
jgi:type IV secretory pathway VirB2 component (pilin)